MSEINSSLIEYARNSGGDTIAIRKLSLLRTITNSSNQTFDLDQAINKELVGKKIEIKHPTDLTKYEIGTIESISSDGLQIVLVSVMAIIYPIDSRIFLVDGEKDVFDSLITNRIEASILFMENDFQEMD